MTTATHPNMSGSQKRSIHAEVQSLLTQQLRHLNRKEGATLKADLDGLLGDIRQAIVKRAKSSKLFSSAAVSLTLSDGTVVTVLTPVRAATFAEWFAAILDVPADTPVNEMAKLLKERGHLVTPSQIGELQKLTNDGVYTGIRMSGDESWAASEVDGSVLVRNVYSPFGGDGLEYQARWTTDDRVVVCNKPMCLGF